MQTAKGTRDFAGEDKLARDGIVAAIKNVFELYGYNPLETPVLEMYDVLSSKYAGGAEILKETFKLKDRGKRILGLRYDLTVPMCRFIAMNPNLKMPFKRYQIGEVFRDGPINLGRYREFYQCDVDVVGVREMSADAEIIKLTQKVFEQLRMDVVIKVNSRKILNGILDYAGVEKGKFETVILSIDKLQKLGADAVKKELKEKKISEDSTKKIISAISIQGSFEKKLEELGKTIKSQEGAEGLKEIGDLFAYLKGGNVEFDISLSRGLAYYTGTVFEAYLKNSEIKSSVAGGGRYDKMIGKFLQSEKEYPAVGISFGLDVMTDVMKLGKESGRKSVVQAYIIPIGISKEAFEIAEKLRNAGINADVDLMGRGISKNLDYANSMAIPYVIFIGGKELKEKKIKLRDMKTGKEELLGVDEVCKRIG